MTDVMHVFYMKQEYRIHETQLRQKLRDNYLRNTAKMSFKR